MKLRPLSELIADLRASVACEECPPLTEEERYEIWLATRRPDKTLSPEAIEFLERPDVIAETREAQRMLAGYPHHHCSGGCDKSLFETGPYGIWVCAFCRAPRVQCNDEICHVRERRDEG